MSNLEAGLFQARARLLRAKDALDTAVCLYLDGDLDGAYRALFTLAQESERLTLTTRILPAYTGRSDALQRIDEMIAAEIQVAIGYTGQGWFGLRFPALLPKKERGSTEYTRITLYSAMRQFFVNKAPQQYNDCVLIFRHIYDRERPERQYRDHDNIEVNMVVDVIALYLLRDDAPLRCQHYYCSIAGDTDATEVFVVPQTEFVTWLTCAPEELKLYETPF